MRNRPRALAFRYVGALLVVAALLVAWQSVVQLALDRQEGDARIVNIAGRQRMLSQRLCMLLLALEVDTPDRADATRAELARVADEWERSQRALREADNSSAITELFALIEPDQRAMLAAASARGSPASDAAIARAHQDAFLSGMDRIVARYEAEARARVVGLRRTELGLLALVLAVLVFEGVFVFRPVVRSLRAYLAERDRAQQALISVSDREQQRLAQDLHDGIGQHLVGVAYLVRSLPPDDRLAEIGRLLTESIEQTRSLARGLYSPTLEAEGLVAALRDLAGHVERVFGIECRVDGESIELEPATRGHLYRIAREAVLNAAKHARASEIAIEVSRDASNVTLVVRDDGVGMTAHANDGLGLHLMESRARMMSASLAITAGEPRGTTITCMVPVVGALV